MPNYGQSRPSSDVREVVITFVNLKNLTAIGQDSFETKYNIDLKQSIGIVNAIPALNEYWFVRNLRNIWVLDRRLSLQNRNLRHKDLSYGDAVVDVKGTFHLKDKDGEWGERMKGLEKKIEALTTPPIWTPFTDFRSGTGPNEGFGFTPAWTIRADEKVLIRGTIGGLTSGTEAIDLLKVPEEIIPDETVQGVGASRKTSSTYGMTRFEINGRRSGATEGILRIFPATTGVTWYSIDNIGYWVH